MLENQPKYFRIERVLLKLGGISLTGDESLTYRIYSLVNVIVFNHMYPFVASIDLFKHNFNDSVDNWFYVVTTLMGNLMISATFRNRLKVGRLLQKLEQKPFLVNTERGGEKEEKLLGEWISFTRNQAIVFSIGVILSIISQVVYTVISRIRTSDYHDWNMGFARITIVNVTYSPNYEISMLYQNLCVCSMAFNACCTTLIISGVSANIGTQFKLLQNNLRRMVYNSQQRMLQEVPAPLSLSTNTMQANSEISWKYLQISLKDTVLFHLAILDIARDLEDVFSGAMLSCYIGTLMLICLEVYRASMLTVFDIGSARLILETLSAMFHSMIICYSGEQMAHQSEEVPKAAFQSNFVGADLKFQKSLVLIIRGSQKPVRIKAGKLIDTSLVTFAWILRTSYSAYMVLRNTNMKENK